MERKVIGEEIVDVWRGYGSIGDGVDGVFGVDLGGLNV